MSLRSRSILLTQSSTAAGLVAVVARFWLFKTSEVEVVVAIVGRGGGSEGTTLLSPPMLGNADLFKLEEGKGKRKGRVLRVRLDALEVGFEAARLVSFVFLWSSLDKTVSFSRVIINQYHVRATHSSLVRHTTAA
jgi:hypothetical protein